MIPATGTLSFGHWGAIFTVASILVMAVNGLVWRFAGRRAIVSAAFYLAAIYLVAEVAQMAAFAYVPRPWAYVVAIPSDLLLLYMARDIAVESNERWPRLLAWTLFGGVMLQVWLWAMYVLHWRERYNWTHYAIYANYAHISTVLGGIELALILWPGLQRGFHVFSRSFNLGGLLPGARHQGVKSFRGPKA